MLVHFTIWHKEIEDIIVLKNNKGSEDNRVRKLDSQFKYQNYFTKDLLKTKILLCLVHEITGLYEAFGTDEFDSLYEKYEKNTKIYRKLVLKLYSLTY